MITTASDSPGYMNNSPAENKPCSIKVTINPKLLAGITDYITAANESYLNVVEKNFNLEAGKISPILKDFTSYFLNRIDFCVNFELRELDINCAVDLIMKLIQKADIPNHFEEWTEYHKTSKRQKPCENSFYLKNACVNINCYGKYSQLQKKYPDNPSLKDAVAVIRFEVQIKYLKIYSVSQAMKSPDMSGFNLIHALLSDEFSQEMVTQYYYKTIRRGDYYTLKTAREKVKRFNFNVNKNDRLIEALELVNACRGIPKAQETLQGKELEDFRRSLKDLETIGINPVTIPQNWKIQHIPNLLDTYIEKIESERSKKKLEQFRQEAFEEYVRDCKKYKKSWLHPVS
ncbi:hypothetical protein U6B65_13435 [Oscillospiraceae bacterium MB08-C2-2]|nr:hypothetical protein U6B65_13435 [Oscillospiraceae bacterium MB08-C2-2]